MSTPPAEPPRNPYAPPNAPIGDTSGPSGTLDLASRGQRFGNTLIDSCGGWGWQWTVQTLLGVLGIAMPDITDLGAYLLASTAVSFVYFAGSEVVFGRTLGKLVTRTHVVAVSGAPASVAQICGRTLIRFIPFDAFSFFGNPVVGWHDRWSGTRVVRTSRAGTRGNARPPG